jgi:hypothetical protein
MRASSRSDLKPLCFLRGVTFFASRLNNSIARSQALAKHRATMHITTCSTRVNTPYHCAGVARIFVA